MTTTAMTPVTVQAPSCWASFTSAASSALRALANGVSKLWAGLKSGFQSLYTTLSPLMAKAVVWMKANPQTAGIGAAVTALVTAVACYCFCTRKPATPAPTNPPAPVVPANPAAPANPAPVGA